MNKIAILAAGLVVAIVVWVGFAVVAPSDPVGGDQKTTEGQQAAEAPAAAAVDKTPPTATPPTGMPPAAAPGPGDNAARRPPGPVAQVPPRAPQRAWVVGLHGRGDTAAGFSRLAMGLPRGLRWHVPQGALTFAKGFEWFDQSKPKDADGQPAGLQTSVRAVAEHLAMLDDHPRVLLGFSQGCMTALHVVTEHPGRVAALVCAGGGVVGRLPSPAAVAKARGSGGLPPVLLVHDRNDKVVPYKAAEEARAALELRGFKVQLAEHTGGHRLPPEALTAIEVFLEEVLEPARQPAAARQP
jgi:phospholipase/carboxylesterase